MQARVLAFLVFAVLAVAWVWWFTSRAARGFAPVSAPWDPPVIVGDVLTAEECKAIIDHTDPKFARSTVVAAKNVDDSRTSETAWLSRDDPRAQKMIAKAMELTGMPRENCEDIQVVRYKPGTYYKAHHDSCCEDNSFCKSFEDRGGQRVGTLLVYLNGDFTEGHTHFPGNDDLKIKADPGSAVFFRPLCNGPEAKCHPKALHAGLPIGQGTKYVCNVWVREGAFR